MMAELRLEIGQRISALRGSLGVTQRELGARLRPPGKPNGYGQVTVARWENGDMMPSPWVLGELVKLAAEEEKDWWREKAGIEKLTSDIQPFEDARIVPFLKDRIAAGRGTHLDPAKIEKRLPLPEEWFPSGSEMVAIKVEGDSMSPLIKNGYYVLVDTSNQDFRQLAGYMVAAWSPHGCTVKWLRREESTGFYQLIPHHVSEEYEVRTITPKNQHEFGILGRVVRFIGEPKLPEKSTSA
jgi:SOS-response transcriptional repressor LexA